MSVDLYATRIQAKVLERQRDVERAYEQIPETTLFWSFSDLISSSNYRLIQGPKAGYVRGEAFSHIVGGVVQPTMVDLIKEIGDSVLLASQEFRPLLECILLIHLVCHRLGGEHQAGEFPLSVRSGIGFGAAKRIARPHSDFVGSPIDELARLMQVRDVGHEIIIHEDAYAQGAPILREYEECCVPQDKRMPDRSATKGLAKTIWFRELEVDWRRLEDLRGNFVPWRELTGKKRPT